MTYREALKKIYDHAFRKYTEAGSKDLTIPMTQYGSKMLNKGKRMAYQDMLDFMQELSRETKKKEETNEE